MPDRTSVVPAAPTVTEEQFETCVTSGWARAQRRLGGQKQLAYCVDMTPKAVGNVMAGISIPGAKRMFDLHHTEGTALDDIADLYGLRIVPKDAVCSSDEKPLSVLVCGLLAKAIEAELDGRTDHSELLGMEAELRAARRAIDLRLEEIAQLRAPRAVA